MSPGTSVLILPQKTFYCWIAKFLRIEHKMAKCIDWFRRKFGKGKSKEKYRKINSTEFFENLGFFVEQRKGVSRDGTVLSSVLKCLANKEIWLAEAGPPIVQKPIMPPILSTG
ncbi:hypothetical protein AVEN_98005-1 [Araneus ventricosus]|uniref:Uncharacterized protein n=1 Tax=Araneus ventricosus TaxID=182803 RepID=A0A4Y2N408_ARAVE|nr:hypothetical protein AVEN_98005-1 [Araneus ventricosus]